MDKSYGEQKRKYICKNKWKKYDGKDNICCRKNTHRTQRHYIKSYINYAKHKNDLLNDLIYPSSSKKWYTWWDDVPEPTRISKLH